MVAACGCSVYCNPGLSVICLVDAECRAKNKTTVRRSAEVHCLVSRVEESDMEKGGRSGRVTVYVFHVELQDDRDIWRRIAIRSDQTLHHLHWAIFEAFDREDPHLYSFFIPKRGKKGRRRIEEGDEYMHPSAFEDLLEPSNRCHSANIEISKLNLEPGTVFYYLFDYGDSWWHTIRVEATEVKPDEGKYPRVIERHGKSPPQYPEAEDDWEFEPLEEYEEDEQGEEEEDRGEDAGD